MNKVLTSKKMFALGIATIASFVMTNNVLANTENTTFTKTDDTIAVNQPEVNLSKDSAAVYDNIGITYQTEIPDNVEINNGDKIVYQLPQELTWTTNQQFDVYNHDQEVVGNAQTNIEQNNVTTTFNDYFKSHPQNKQFTLNLNAQFNRNVVNENEEKLYNLDFNGTVIPATAQKSVGPSSTEIVAKWGWQTQEDPDTIQWGGRVNLMKDNNMINVHVSDTWDSNQEYVPGSLRMYYLKTAEPWEMEYELNTDFVMHRRNGFDFSIANLNGRTISLTYQTRLKNRNASPYNVLGFKADNNREESFDRVIELANGSGMAIGEKAPVVTFIPSNPPTIDKPELPFGTVPNDAPVLDKPELPFGTVPNDAPVLDKPELPFGTVPNDAPVLDKPELPFGTVPNDAPVLDKPELPFGTVPNDAPVLDKPELPFGTVPNDAPVLDKPELPFGTVPNETPVYDKPELPFGTVPNDAPVLDLPELHIELPKNEEPKTPETPKSDEPVTPTLQVEPRVESEKKVLPKTGDAVLKSLVLTVTGLGLAAFVTKKRFTK